MKFRNPANGYEEEPKLVFLWALLFGALYFAAMRCWTHALISAFLAILTGGISWFIYPFFAKDIVKTQYLRNGWTLVSA